MFRRKILPSLLAASFACLGTLACGSDPGALSPLAPSAELVAHGGDVAPASDDLVSIFRATPCETKVNVNGSGVFGPGGGTLLFGTSRLIIPGGALRDTVTISATIPNGDFTRVEFRPQGLEFAKPAGLLLDTSGCSMNGAIAPNVVYLSESGVVLETILAVYDPHWHTIAAPIWHFSGYAIAF